MNREQLISSAKACLIAALEDWDPQEWGDVDLDEELESSGAAYDEAEALFDEVVESLKTAIGAVA